MQYYWIYFSVIAILLFKAIPSFSAIYDCFAFNNELEILDIRLHELYDHVDKFVIVEWTQTHRGSAKPLYLKENFEKFAKFHNKIIHIILDEPMFTSDPGGWARENFQRNSIMMGLQNCHPDDIIIISDADELIRSDTIPKIVELLYQQKAPAVVCEQTLYRFYLNAKDHSGWGGTVACTYANLEKTSPTALRLNRERGWGQWCYPFIRDAGWHFTSMGGFKRFTQKIDAGVIHQGDNIARYYRPRYMGDYLRKQCTKVSIDASYPKYVIENESSLREAGFIY